MGSGAAGLVDLLANNSLVFHLVVRSHWRLLALTIFFWNPHKRSYSTLFFLSQGPLTTNFTVPQWRPTWLTLLLSAVISKLLWGHRSLWESGTFKEKKKTHQVCIGTQNASVRGSWTPDSACTLQALCAALTSYGILLPWPPPLTRRLYLSH